MMETHGNRFNNPGKSSQCLWKSSDLWLEKKKKSLHATERVRKNGPLCILLRFTAPLRMALNWLWSVGFEEKCTASESLWTCTKVSWGRTMVPHEWRRAVNLKAAQFLHCDMGTCCMLNPGSSVLLWHGSRLAWVPLHAGLACNFPQQMID